MASASQPGASHRSVSGQSQGKRCKDCGDAVKPRPAPFPGPRCATHHRVIKKIRSAASHERMVTKTYGLLPGDYEILYQAQGGRCWLCQRATGKTKRLAVDHDHSCEAGHPKNVGCRLCVRALLCGPCNKLIGWYRDSPEAFERAAAYLRQPPARTFLSEARVSG